MCEFHGVILMLQDFGDTVCVYALNTLKTGDNLSITNYPITLNSKVCEAEIADVNAHMSVSSKRDSNIN